MESQSAIAEIKEEMTEDKQKSEINSQKNKQLREKKKRLEEQRSNLKVNGLLGAAALEREGAACDGCSERAEMQEGKVKLGKLSAAHTSLAKLKKRDGAEVGNTEAGHIHACNTNQHTNTCTYVCIRQAGYKI